MATSQWSFGNARPVRPNPGEPLYTVEELAVRFRVEANSLRALMGSYPGLKPWGTSPGGRTTKYRNYYRLSDARKWWRDVQEKRNAKNIRRAGE